MIQPGVIPVNIYYHTGKYNAIKKKRCNLLFPVRNNMNCFTIFKHKFQGGWQLTCLNINTNERR
jgi:hypothetical protein